MGLKKLHAAIVSISQLVVTCSFNRFDEFKNAVLYKIELMVGPKLGNDRKYWENAGMFTYEILRLGWVL